jgi:hypothetical protein
MSQKSAKGVLLQKSGERPERKGVASKSRDLRSDQRQKSQLCLASRTPERSEAPRDVYKGTESLSGDAQYRKPGYSQLAQPTEPPYADPYCGVGGEDGQPSPYPDFQFLGALIATI